MKKFSILLLFLLSAKITICQETQQGSNDLLYKNLPSTLKATLVEIIDKELFRDSKHLEHVELAYKVFDKYGNIGKKPEEIEPNPIIKVKGLNKDIEELKQRGISDLAIHHALILDFNDHLRGDNKRNLWGVCDDFLTKIPCLSPTPIALWNEMNYHLCNKREFITGCEHCLSDECSGYGYGDCDHLKCPEQINIAFLFCNCTAGLGCPKTHTCRYFDINNGYEYGYCDYNLPNGDPIPYDWEMFPLDFKVCIPTDPADLTYYNTYFFNYGS